MASVVGDEDEEILGRNGEGDMFQPSNAITEATERLRVLLRGETGAQGHTKVEE